MIRRILAVLAIVVTAAAVAALARLLWPLPTRRGTVAIAGLSTPVDVRFDAQGVPHVRAVLELDAWRALGWLHASDRLFQMELRRRAARGRLAELFGPAAVDRDREARRLGYAALAERDWEAADEEDRDVLSAYADGVNAFLDEHPVPLELSALGVPLEPWTPIDTLAFQRLMYDTLSMSAATEQNLFDDARARGVAAAIKWYDASEGGTTEVSPEIAAFVAEAGTVAAVDRPDPMPAGSNAWAIAGSHTASRRPLLAGDPHLNAERPGVWYAAHLASADGLDVAGLTLAGGPGVLIGHNGRVAWSITMNQADDADLFVEKIDDAKGAWLRGSEWVPFERRTETIRVKGAPDAVEQVLRTAHGPIVARFGGRPGFALTRQAATDDRVQSIRAFLDADHAKNGAALVAAYAKYGGPAINVCWAESAGGIGVKVAGSIPRRRAGDGRFPVPGWTGDYDWDGAIPYDALPSVTSPPEGFVASANDDWSAAGTPLPFPGLYASSDRVLRARRLASGVRAGRVETMRTMQNDLYSPYAARLIAALHGMTFADPRARRAASILEGWDDKAEMRGPSRLFYAFLKKLRGAIAGGPAGGTSGSWVTWSLLDRMLGGQAPAGLWDDPATARVETRESVVERALAAALEETERDAGRDPKHWNWGNVHELAYPHPFASVLPKPLARRLAFGPVALGGEWHTLDVAGFSLRRPGYEVVHIPSARLIVDLGDPDASRLVLPLGQSGQLFDRHAHDELDAWSRGRDFPLPFTAKAVAAATVSSLQFVPAD